MNRKKRVAVYGGTFDPVHNGHLAIAKSILTLFDLDEILFVPAFVAPHKRDVKSSAAWHRYAMLAIETREEEKMRLSTIELDAPEKPFTIQTLSRLQNEWGDLVRQFFIMGADSWADIRTWRDWEKLLLMTNHIVVTRPGYKLDRSHITEEARERIVNVCGKRAEEVHEILERENEPGIYVTDALQIDISASKIRQKVREGKEDWSNDVPVSVATYINKYELYKEKVNS